DLNGDGRSDLVSGDWGDGTVSVLLAQPTGGYAPRVPYPAGIVPNAVLAADLDTDGDIDLAIVNQNDVGALTILFNDGTGQFAPPVSYPITGYPTAIAAADLDHDGAPDLAIACGNPGRVLIYHNDGHGAFIQQQDYTIPYPTFVA